MEGREGRVEPVGPEGGRTRPLCPSTPTPASYPGSPETAHGGTSTHCPFALPAVASPVGRLSFGLKGRERELRGRGPGSTLRAPSALEQHGCEPRGSTARGTLQGGPVGELSSFFS